MVSLLQVTIGAVGVQPTRATATNTPACFAIVQGDDGNSNPSFMGGSTTTTANGIRFHNSATLPEARTLGPFTGNFFDLSELYFAGTENEKVNILFIQH